ncbi:alpha/beta fold hydrolase [Actinomycetospora sp. CA-053990]|uniref:alpha/beta fold hydrolase n=1 Tax=Actinomycetospora sp. CA-053990 TaxID=3239891 RepID=UPI003D935C88
MSTPTSTPTSTGYAPVGDLQMYYELHGPADADGTPLLLLHGGLFDIDLQFGAVLPGLSADRRVIATDFQGHGRTNDLDRPLSSAALAGDVVALLAHLGVGQVDVFGFSVGGAVALELLVNHPELVRRAVISSVSFTPDGMRPENAAVGEMKVEMIEGTRWRTPTARSRRTPRACRGCSTSSARSTVGRAGATRRSRALPRPR